MTIQQPLLTSEQITEITNYVNAYREKNQAPPLTWDTTIAEFAQSWSFNLISNNEFKHSGNHLYGENLAYFQGYGTDVMALLKKAIDLWYDEIRLYNFNNPGFSSATGHFTCLVWKSSTNFGMGISINDVTNAVDITMNTSPPGNYIGQFQENVLPLIPSPNPSPKPLPKPLSLPKPKHIHVNIPSIMQKYTGYKVYKNKSESVMDCSFNDLPVVHLSANMPFPSANKQMLIHSLYNLLNQVQTGRPMIILINLINEIIYSVNNMEIP
jgi:hypothetical protein